MPVADGKAPAVTGHPAQRIRTIKARQKFLHGGNENLSSALFAPVFSLHLLPQHAGCQPLADEISVRGRFRKLPGIDIRVKQLSGVGQIEIAGQEQHPFEARGLVHERMAEPDVSLPVGRIAQMSEKHRLVHPAALRQQRQQIREGALRRRFEFVIGRFSGFGRQCKRHRPRSILSPIVLFLKEQGKLGASEVDAPAFLRLFGGASAKPQERHRAFMSDFVGHLSTRKAFRDIWEAATCRPPRCAQAHPLPCAGKPSR